MNVQDTPGLTSTGLALLQLMKRDIQTCLQTGVPLVVAGEGPLRALLTVVEVAEHATAKASVAILGADGKVVA